jgi:hypothetical protein
MRKVLLIFLLISFFSLPLFAQDPGVADTVRLTNISGEIGDSVSMPVYLYNDEEVVSVVIPLLLDGYSGWFKFDSVSYVGGRLADPAVLDQREVYVFDTDTFTVSSLLLSFSVSSGNNLSSGNGKLCELWFTLLFGGEVLVDSLSDSPQGSLSLTDSGLNSFTPQFTAASIDISCDYKVGDITFDNNVSVSDVVSLQKLYRFDGPPGSYPVFYYCGRADLNCDRRLDMRDLSYLVRYLFRGGSHPCTCSTINPPLYDDPGLPDSVWVQNRTMVLGIPSPICFGVVNDETLSGVALSFNIDGNATLVWDSESGLMLTERGHSNFSIWDTRLPPDSVNFNFYGYEVGSPLSIGNEAVCCPIFTPQSAGSATFSLTSWLNTSPSMLVTRDNSAAILPVLYGGNITVLPYLTGDPNHNGVIDVSDVVYLINYLFKGGPEPDPLESGDANCDGQVTVSDVVYLINYLFKGGPAPAC